jgi:hypothetical protein
MKRDNNREKNMSMVAKYSAAFAGSALVAALGDSAVTGFSPDLLLQAHFWIVTLSLTGLAGLAFGNGISTPRQTRALGYAQGSLGAAA